MAAWWLLLALACDKTDDNCDAWTVEADACLEAVGDAPAYVEGVDCTEDPAKTDLHRCMYIAWNNADCSTPESVEQTEIAALECTQ